MSRQVLISLTVATICSISAGCTSYYKVTNPLTGATYYTDQLDRQASGSVILKDGRTGDEITLGSSAIRKIDESEYRQALAVPPPAPATEPSTFK